MFTYRLNSLRLACIIDTLTPILHAEAQSLSGAQPSPTTYPPSRLSPSLARTPTSLGVAAAMFHLTHRLQHVVHNMQCTLR